MFSRYYMCGDLCNKFNHTIARYPSKNVNKMKKIELYLLMFWNVHTNNIHIKTDRNEEFILTL